MSLSATKFGQAMWQGYITVGEDFTVNRTSELQAPGGFLQNVLQFNPSPCPSIHEMATMQDP